MPTPTDPATLGHFGERVELLLRQQRELVERLGRDQRHFQRLARSVWRVQEDERRRLARELHDGLGQNLTALLRLIDGARDALAEATPTARALLDQAHDLADATLQDTRELSRLLRPQILDDLGLAAALRWLARTFAETHGLPVALDLAEPLPAFDNDTATLIFRVAQEALGNSARHARARTARLGLRVAEGRVHLHIADDGRGCVPAQALASSSEGRSTGLGGMRERVRLFGGELRVDSAPGEGFRVAAEFPWPGADGKIGP